MGALKTDVAIVGAGPAGSGSAIFLRDRGISTVVVEKERFPRFHVGESMTGWAAEKLRTLGLEQAALSEAEKAGELIISAFGHYELDKGRENG